MCSKKDHERAAKQVSEIPLEAEPYTGGITTYAHITIVRDAFAEFFHSDNSAFNTELFNSTCVDLRFPNVDAIAKELREVNEHCETECDVRLQCQATGASRFTVRVGDSSYDTDHRGFWGSGSLPGYGKRFNARSLAQELIEQAKSVFCESL
jgi:hypothetical protein